MARDENPPFARGETYFNGGIINASDPLGLGGYNLEGKEFLFEVNDPAAPTATADPSGRQVRVRVVRNRSGANLKPSRLARLAVGAAQGGYPLGCSTDGYTYAETDPVLGVIDEFLPAAGVPNLDLFYVVVEGPTTFISATTGTPAITAGGRLIPASGTSATSADSGTVAIYPTSSPTFVDGDSIVGRADVVATVTTTSTLVPGIARRRVG